MDQPEWTDQNASHQEYQTLEEDEYTCQKSLTHMGMNARVPHADTHTRTQRTTAAQRTYTWHKCMVRMPMEDMKQDMLHAKSGKKM
jgi:hypothetical protein